MAILVFLLLARIFVVCIALIVELLFDVHALLIFRNYLLSGFLQKYLGTGSRVLFLLGLGCLMFPLVGVFVYFACRAVGMETSVFCLVYYGNSGFGNSSRRLFRQRSPLMCGRRLH